MTIQVITMYSDANKVNGLRLRTITLTLNTPCAIQHITALMGSSQTQLFLLFGCGIHADEERQAVLDRRVRHTEMQKAENMLSLSDIATGRVLVCRHLLLYI